MKMKVHEVRISVTENTRPFLQENAMKGSKIEFLLQGGINRVFADKVEFL